ncbi:MAG TPA: hypothetical protein DCK98_09230 [Chloroflexi bacterium]|nr:hypothetical protein [Chloroflexota bacterium]HAL28447.1 hypothetical protein [Chloroflexota bacterium]
MIVSRLAAAAASYGEVIRSPRYFPLWLGQLVSNFGDTLHYIALVVLVFQLSGQGLAVAGLVVAEVIPVLVLGPIAGVVIDRFSRKAVLIGADLVRAALVLSLLWPQGVWHAYVVAAGLAAGGTFFDPTVNAVIPGPHDTGAAARRELGVVVDRTIGPDRRRVDRRRDHRPLGREPGVRGQRRKLPRVGRTHRRPHHPAARGPARGWNQARSQRVFRRREGRTRLRPPRPAPLASPHRPIARLVRRRRYRRDARGPLRTPPAAAAGRVRVAHRCDRGRGARRATHPEHVRPRLPECALVVRPVRDPGNRRRAHRGVHPASDRPVHPVRLRAQHLHGGWSCSARRSKGRSRMRSAGERSRSST